MAVCMQVMLGRMHVVSGTGANKLDPVMTADCHTSSVTLSPSHNQHTQHIHSQVCDARRHCFHFYRNLTLLSLSLFLLLIRSLSILTAIFQVVLG